MFQTTNQETWDNPIGTPILMHRVTHLTAVLSREERLEPTASISSMKTMQGACFRASQGAERAPLWGGEPWRGLMCIMLPYMWDLY